MFLIIYKGKKTNLITPFFLAILSCKVAFFAAKQSFSHVFIVLLYRIYGVIMQNIIKIFIAVMVVSVLGACSATKFIPEGDYMLEKVTLTYDSLDAPTAEVLTKANLKGYIRQHPNSKWFSLVKVPMAPYALSGLDSTKSINRFLQRIGEPPVVFDSLLANRTQVNIQKAVNNLGFLDAQVIQAKQAKRKKMKLNFIINPRERYYVRNINYYVEDSVMASLLAREYFSKLSALHSGIPFDLNVLDAERSAINAFLQDCGYYHFNKELVSYEVNPIGKDKQVDLDLIIPLYRASTLDKPRLHQPYHVRSVSFVSNVVTIDEMNDSTPVAHKVVAQGYPIYYKDKLSFRPSVFTQNSEIKKGQLYQESKVQQTYSNFARLGGVMFSNVKFNEVDSLPGHLDCVITIHENKRRSLGAELEGTNSSGDLGAALLFTYQDRNAFRGSELFSVSARGAFEAITGLEGYSDQNYVELSVEAKLTFPTFMMFGLQNNKKGLLKTTSEVALMYDSQNRPEFHRRVLTGALRYRWQSPRGTLKHRVDLVDLNYVFMPWISETFRHDYLESETDRNAILRYNYENLFIMRLGYTLNYNSQQKQGAAMNYGTNALAVRFSAESAGNLLYGASHLFNTSQNSEAQYTLFNIAYAQYVKGDLDVSKSFRFDDRNSLALHLGVGVAYPYGNSTILPYEKRYFSGGANSVRGWSVRELGPGRFTGGDGRIDFINQTGDIKLDINAEYRTSLFWKLHGALFIDAGNIWTIRSYNEQPGGQFRFHSFWREIAVAYGLGLRLNFDYFILRLDGGMKAINPAYTDARRHYPILHPKFSRDFSLHFAVGLPF